MHRAQRLEELLRHRPVAVHAYVSPRDGRGGARNEEVGCEVESFARGGGEEVVEPVHFLRVERKAVLAAGDRAAVMVVQADRVVAEALQAHHQRVRDRVRREVGRETQGHAVEAHGLPRTPLKLEVSADVPHPAVFAGRGVREAHAGEIQCAARLDLPAVFDGDPVVARLDDEGEVGLRDDRLVGGNRKRVPLRLALPPRPPRKRSDSQGVFPPPLPIVLYVKPLFAVHRERQRAPRITKSHGRLGALTVQQRDAAVFRAGEHAGTPPCLPRPARHGRGRLHERAAEDDELHVLNRRVRIDNSRLAVRQLLDRGDGPDKGVRAVQHVERRDARFLNRPAALAGKRTPARQRGGRTQHARRRIPAEAHFAGRRKRHVKRMRLNRRRRNRHDAEPKTPFHCLLLFTSAQPQISAIFILLCFCRHAMNL